jgi:hypothetical protein
MPKSKNFLVRSHTESERISQFYALSHLCRIFRIIGIDFEIDILCLLSLPTLIGDLTINLTYS